MAQKDIIIFKGTTPAMDSFKQSIKGYGVPISLYLERHTICKSTGKSTIEDELNNRRPMSRFERRLESLGLRVIHASSP